MATYADNAAARERADRKRAQDNFLRSQAAEFDLSAQDNHMKYERPSFAIVTASEAYREGWDRIFKKDNNHDVAERTLGKSEGSSVQTPL